MLQGSLAILTGNTDIFTFTHEVLLMHPSRESHLTVLAGAFNHNLATGFLIVKLKLIIGYGLVSLSATYHLAARECLGLELVPLKKGQLSQLEHLLTIGAILLGLPWLPQVYALLAKEFAAIVVRHRVIKKLAADQALKHALKMRIHVHGRLEMLLEGVFCRESLVHLCFEGKLRLLDLEIIVHLI